MNKGRQISVVVILVLSLIIGPGHAQDKETAPEGIIAKPPKSSGLEVNLELNRPRYRPGGEVEMELDLNKEAYLYLYNIDTQGKVNLLFPNKYEKNNRLGPGKVTLPGKGYSFIAGREEGTEYLGAIASTQPLVFFTSIDQEEFENNPFPRLSRNAKSFALTGKEKISSEVSQKDWATDWIKVKITEELSEISVVSHPSNAEVYVDGRFVGRTPGTVSVKPGTREVTLKRLSYKDWSDTVSVQPYAEKRIEAELQPIKVTRLTVRSTPSGADVYVDDEFQGRTPVGFFTETGTRSIRVSKQGYETWKKSLEVQPYLNRNLEVDLREIKFSRLSVESTPSGASVYVGGEDRGTTPTELRLRADKPLEIVLKKEGYEKWERTLTLTSNRNENINVDLRALKEKTSDSLTDKPELGLRFNGGGVFGSVFSLGTEIEVNDFFFGGSFRSTGSKEVPDEIHWVSKTWEGGEVLNYGPEWEVYLGYELELFQGLHFRAGPGIALQPKANLEPTENSTSSLTTVRPLIYIGRHAHLALEPQLTIQAGFGVSQNRYSIDLIYHNRRGPILNFGFKF